MSKQLRIGVVGTGWWVETMHLPALKSHLQAEVVALCGRNRARAQLLAEKFAVPQIYADYRTMFDGARLDAVVISTPDDTHYEVAIAAFDAGLHVLCEKPLAMNKAQAEAMLARAEASGCKHMIYFTFRWLPHMRYLFELVDEGYLGEHYHGYFRWLLAYPPFLIDGWRARPDRANGLLADVGSHLVDIAHRTLGEIAQVHAHIRSWPHAADAAGERLGPANDAAVAMLQFASGAMGVIQVSSVAHTAGQWEGWQVLLHGEKGSLELSHTPDGELVLYGARRGEASSRPLPLPAHVLTGLTTEQAENPKTEDVFTRQAVGARLFIDAILHDQPVTPSFYEGFKAQQVVVYLDAAVPEAGESLLDLLKPDQAAGLIELAQNQGKGWYIPANQDIEPRLCAHPWQTLVDPVRLTGNLAAEHIPHSYIFCTEKPEGGLATTITKGGAAKAKRKGWGYYEIATDHEPEQNRPDELAAILQQLA